MHRVVSVELMNSIFNHVKIVRYPKSGTLKDLIDSYMNNKTTLTNEG